MHAALPFESFSSALAFYSVKADQHLRRVVYFHRLALAGMGGAQGSQEAQVVADLFDPGTDPASKMSESLRQASFLQLKVHFELYLTKVLRAVWHYHYDTLVTLPMVSQVKMTLQEALDPDRRRHCILAQMVPRHGLDRILSGMTQTTAMDLKRALNSHPFAPVHGFPVERHCVWPQISVAFEVRHLVEHNNGVTDPKFCSSVRALWKNTSWSDLDAPAPGQRVPVRPDDLQATAAALLGGVAVARDKLGAWTGPESA